MFPRLLVQSACWWHVRSTHVVAECVFRLRKCMCLVLHPCSCSISSIVWSCAFAVSPTSYWLIPSCPMFWPVSGGAIFVNSELSHIHSPLAHQLFTCYRFVYCFRKIDWHLVIVYQRLPSMMFGFHAFDFFSKHCCKFV